MPNISAMEREVLMFMYDFIKKKYYWGHWLALQAAFEFSIRISSNLKRMSLFKL